MPWAATPRTLWDKVSGSSETILYVQEKALLDLGALADKAQDKKKAGALMRALKDIERDVGLQLAILARCFELQDEFRVVELDHVFATAPENLEGHRRGVAAARQKRRETVLESTSRLMGRLDAAGGIANDNILLHARAARSVIDSLNATGAIIDDFHTPLGIESTRNSLSLLAWREALADPRQRRTAAKEAGQYAVMGVLSMAALAAYTVQTKDDSKPSA